MKKNKLLPDLDVTFSDRKRLGAFYTPQELSDLMAAWAITKSSDRVLEPSFGGCGFLKSCADRFKELGGSVNRLPLYGCDIDPNAFQYLANTVGNLVDVSRFSLGDFLTLDKPKSWPENFNVILGNPPYIPYQQISKKSRTHALNQIKELGFDMDLRSSLWAYFIILGLKYLAPEGKIAWVLPGSILQANYSHSLRKFLGSKFEKIAAFQIKERLFLYEGTDETTVVLLGTGYKKEKSLSATDIPLIYCKSYKELRTEVSQWQKNGVTTSSCASPILGFLSQEAKNTYRTLENHPECKTLGEYASIKIGLVTGANKFFVINKEIAAEHSLIPSNLIPVLGKFSAVEGLSFSKDDHKNDLKNGNRCLLISSNKEKPKNKELKKYLKSFPEKDIESTSTFKKRKLWHSIQDKKIPDAFFPVMHHTGPQIALNTAKINCTNSIHRVYFKNNISLTKKRLIAISLLCSFSQLSAEIEGRKYGSGVLKHEPRESEKIKILIPHKAFVKVVNKEYNKIDALLREGKISEARASADCFISKHSKLSGEQFKTLSNALSKARKHRHANRKKTT